jgi:DNA topoisomerase-1
MALNSYIVEPPGIFMTRGKHPKYGCIKPRLKQSDITINASEPLEGDWKAQICNKEGFYIASWKQQVTGDTKYILFGSNSPVRQENDMIKFDKVHNLVKNLPNILSHIEKDLENNVGYQRKLATCCMLIASLAIRVGDEKGEDEADTRGATTLQAKHFTISNDQVTLDFLGKDSIRYHRAITMSPAMCANLSQLLSNKEPDELMFNGISSKEVNEYFSSILAGTTAKQFRTAYGSKLLADNLQGIKQELTEREKLKAFNDANLVVAEKLNHHKAPPKNAKEQIGSKKDSLKNLKEEYKKIQKSVKSAKSDKEKLLAKQTACANKIQNMEDKIELQQKMLTVSMGTSKTNYSDPRITYSFCKKHGVNINTIYTATLQDKFSWAQNIDDSFFQNYGKII